MLDLRDGFSDFEVGGGAGGGSAGISGRPAKASGAESLERRFSKVA